jgi:hypothetical protein
MRRILLAALLAASCAYAASPKTDVAEKIAVDQLVATVSGAQQAADADMAKKLTGLELTERLGEARLAELSAKLPGEKSRMALKVLADRSIFLAPPEGERPADAAPDAAAMRQMLVKIVGYVNTTVRQLPNLMATRSTSGFEDRPQEEKLTDTGIESLGYLPLHWVGSLKVTVTYRDRKEVEDASVKPVKEGNGVGGLQSTGEFGPILSTVVADAVKGKITWARWEKGPEGTLAVFHYAVPADKSNYRVQFCCIVTGYAADGTPEREVFNELAAYHGEIVFNPADGSIRLLTLEAEMPAGGLVEAAGIAIEYAATEIAGRSYICPVKSVSILGAHTGQQNGLAARSKYQGGAKTFLNDVAFTDYRRFGSEARVLPAAVEAGPQ